MIRSPLLPVLTILFVVALSMSSSMLSASNDVSLQVYPSELLFIPNVSYHRANLKISVGNAAISDVSVGSDKQIVFRTYDKNGKSIKDGSYRYELTLFRFPSASDLAADGRPSVLSRRLPTVVATMTGAFTVRDGEIPLDEEPGPGGRGPASGDRAARGGTAQPFDVVTSDDQITIGSLCVGLDCVNNENFDFDTIRLKENNLRIKFDDTSSTGSFPSNDWQLTANDSSSGGRSMFAIDDVTNARTPFLVTAGAPTSSLYIDSSGRLGLGTSSPVKDVDVVSGDTPAVRFNQDGTSGYTAQTWDVAGNEANFFVRDVTAGSRLPFRIFPGSPQNSLAIAASGNIGLGTYGPTASLHLARPAQPTILLDHVTSGVQWRLRMTDFSTYTDGFEIGRSDGTGASLRLYPAGNAAFYNGADLRLAVTAAGNLWIAGTLTQSSSRAVKGHVVSAESLNVLGHLKNLEVALWSYKHDAPTVKHLGPFAEDFHAAFGLGESSTGIAVSDVAGVALVAVKELQAELEAKNARIDEMSARIAQLEAVVQKLAADRISP
ncbi:MAG: hypothetical protein HYV63_07810 [Candidatus Schekmanbacteria bacterium]|nr:hypothetical protein [Candidatus Schekmanbacteria bacterium]